MKNANPARLVALIFLLIGAVFLTLGLIFVSISSELLPQLSDPAVWLTDDPPAELELPIVGVVFSALGFCLVLVPVFVMVFQSREKRRREELERFGTRVQGVVTALPVDRSYHVNGRSPLRIMAEARNPYTGETVKVKGPLVWETSLSEGDVVTVVFDPQDERQKMVLLPEV